MRSRPVRSFSRSTPTLTEFLIWTMPPRFGVTGIVSWTSERKSRTTTPSTPGCSCAALCSLTSSMLQPRMATARSLMACASWPGNEDCGRWRSAKRIGKTLTLPRPWHMPKAFSTGDCSTSQCSRVWPLSRIAMTRRGLRLLAGVLGVVLLTHLVRRAGPAKLLESISSLGWGLGLVVALGGVAHLVKTWAWRFTLLDEKREASFARMLGLRLASEAVGQFGVIGQAFGETLRVALLSSTMPLASGITSVALDRALFILSAAAVSALGLIAVLVVLPLPGAFSLYAGLFAFTLLGIILVTATGLRKRWAMLSGTAETLGRVRYFSGWIERKRSLIHSVEHKLFDFYHNSPRAFWGSFALNLACHAVAVLEVYLILWLMGTKIGLFAAFAIEALTKLVNVLGLFNPGNVGTYEGGNMITAKMFGISGAAGLTLGLTRRIRAIFWAAVGGVCLVILSKTRQHTDGSTGSRIPTSPPDAQSKSGATCCSHVAVILANNLPGDSAVRSLPQVGALPVLLR